MPTNKALEAFQKQLDTESKFDEHIFEKSGLSALTGKGSFSELGLQGSGTYMTMKTPDLDELDGTIDLGDID
jgi:hypothetical protein